MARSLRSIPTENALTLAIRAYRLAHAEADNCAARVEAEVARLEEQARADVRYERSQEAYVTVAWIAEHLGLSKRYVYSLIQSKRLPAVNLGTELRVQRSDLDAYLDGLREEQSA